MNRFSDSLLFKVLRYQPESLSNIAPPGRSYSLIVSAIPRFSIDLSVSSGCASTGIVDLRVILKAHNAKLLLDTDDSSLLHVTPRCSSIHDLFSCNRISLWFPC